MKSMHSHGRRANLCLSIEHKDKHDWLRNPSGSEEQPDAAESNTPEPRREVWKMTFHPRLGLLTSTVHDFPDGGGWQDVLAAEVIGQLAAQGHDDGHHQMREGRQYAYLQPHTDSRGYDATAQNVAWNIWIFF